MEVGALLGCPQLEEVDLSENPLSSQAQAELEAVTGLAVLLSPRRTEDWEDLEI